MSGQGDIYRRFGFPLFPYNAWSLTSMFRAITGVEYEYLCAHIAAAFVSRRHLRTNNIFWYLEQLRLFARAARMARMNNKQLSSIIISCAETKQPACRAGIFARARGMACDSLSGIT